jgi:hypothetical protein
VKLNTGNGNGLYGILDRSQAYLFLSLPGRQARLFYFFFPHLFTKKNICPFFRASSGTDPLFRSNRTTLVIQLPFALCCSYLVGMLIAHEKYKYLWKQPIGVKKNENVYKKNKNICNAVYKNSFFKTIATFLSF